MHNRTKVAILSATSNVIWFILTFIWNCFRVTHLEGEELARSWGIYFLILVAGFLVLIALSAILVMTKEKRSGGQGFEEIIDERDRHIEVFVMKVFGLVFFSPSLLSLAYWHWVLDYRFSSRRGLHGVVVRSCHLDNIHHRL